MRISLPLNLALLRAFVVRAGRERHVVPVSHVVATLDLASSLRADGSREACETLQGRVPLVRLARLLGRSGGGETLALLLETPGGRLALAVDEVLGPEEVVVKPLDARFVRGPAWSGATFLGDGRVALILAVGAWMEAGLDGSRAPLRPTPPPEGAA